MKAFIIYDEPFASIAKAIAITLREDHQVHEWTINSLSYSINEHLVAQYNLLILFISKESINNEQALKVTMFLSNFFIRNPDTIIITIYESQKVEEAFTSTIPFADFLILNTLEGRPELTQRIKSFINEVIKTYVLYNQQEFKKTEKKKENIEQSATTHLTPISVELKGRETSLENSAIFWFRLGYASLAVALLAPFIIYFINPKIDLNSLPTVIFYSIKSVVIVLLAISLSKYASSLARAYMNESRKVADRRHAISFGEFALKVSTEPLQTAELKDLFKEWNISGNSSFLSSPTEDHDPKLLEKVKAIILATRGKEEK